MVTRWLHWILLCGWTVCVLAGAQPRSAARAQEGTRVPSEVLLLEGNRVMRGRITEGKESLSVEQDAAGIVIVPKAQVRFQGPDMHSIYAFLLDGLPKDADADDHVRLARWCISYKMLPEARFELETALEQEPGREDIRRNLATLDAFANRSAEGVKPVKSQSPAQRQARALGPGADEVESLGGLSREVGQQFTTRIQPILMHNCTNSACHGPLAEHELKFTMVRLGSNSLRSNSEKNLLALLRYVDREKPRSSSLWKILNTNHGAQGSSIFTGSKGSQQLQSCKDWVLSLSTETETTEPVKTTSRKRDRVTQVSGTKSDRKVSAQDLRPGSPEKEDFSQEEPPRGAPRGTNTPKSKPGTTIPRSRTTITSRRTTVPKQVESESTDAAPEQSDSSHPEVEPIVSKTRESTPELPPEDPFDPEVFNRRQRMKRNQEE